MTRSVIVRPVLLLHSDLYSLVSLQTFLAVLDYSNTKEMPEKHCFGSTFISDQIKCFRTTVIITSHFTESCSLSVFGFHGSGHESAQTALTSARCQQAKSNMTKHVGNSNTVVTTLLVWLCVQYVNKGVFGHMTGSLLSTDLMYVTLDILRRA